LPALQTASQFAYSGRQNVFYRQTLCDIPKIDKRGNISCIYELKKLKKKKRKKRKNAPYGAIGILL